MLRYWRVFLLALVLLGAGAYNLYGIFSNKGYQPEQPIPFSHVIHAGVLQMECLYCHSSAEKSAHAGVPSLDLCMGCHSLVRTDSPLVQKLAEYYENNEPVPWVRIHRLPDHAYFSHKWHVAAGVACQECHGPVQSMPVVQQWRKLEMKDCMDCHRQDQFVDQIYHPPTYHEAPYSGDEASDGALLTAAAQLRADAGYQSAVRYMETYHGPDLSRDEANALLSRLHNYQQDRYIHGRGALLRGANASIECSTCHY